MNKLKRISRKTNKSFCASETIIVFSLKTGLLSAIFGFSDFETSSFVILSQNSSVKNHFRQEMDIKKKEELLGRHLLLNH